jgi:hypothetical protein
MFVRILVGFLVSVIGFYIVYKSEWLLRNVGRVSWAEYNMAGGTRAFYKLGGLITSLVGLMIMTNLIENILLFLLGFLVPGVRN